MATGNHFWLDCLAGMALALLAMTIVYRGRTIRLGVPSARSRSRTATA